MHLNLKSNAQPVNMDNSMQNLCSQNQYYFIVLNKKTPYNEALQYFSPHEKANRRKNSEKQSHDHNIKLSAL